MNILFFLLLTFLLPYSSVEAKPFQLSIPTKEDTMRAILQAANVTGVRPPMLYGLFGQETGYGRNVGKTESAWAAFCASRNTEDCRSWKKYDCKGDYRNARYYDVVLKSLGFTDGNGNADRTNIPTSSTCALGFTQFEPNTWWGVVGKKNDKIYNPWNINDAILVAAIHLRDLGAGADKALSGNDVIGISDRIALQKYYCGGWYQRMECVAYARGVERKTRLALETLLREGFQKQLEILEKERNTLRQKLGRSALPVTQPERKVDIPATPVPSEGVEARKEASPPPTPQQPSQPPPSPLRVVTGSLPEPKWRVPYRTVLSADGGASPYTWSAVNISGTPFAADEWSLDMNGTLSATPQTGPFVYLTAKVTDSKGESATEVFSLHVSQPPSSQITDDELADEAPAGVIRRSNGDLFMLTRTYNYEQPGRPSGLYGAISKDLGKTWTAPFRISLGGQFIFAYDYSVVENDAGDFVIFTRDVMARAVTATSKDGKSWENVVEVPAIDFDQSLGTIAQAKDGSYLVSFSSAGRGDPNADVYIVRSKDRVTWDAPVRVSSGAGSEFDSSLFAASDGTLYLAYTSYAEGKVIVAASQNGASWRTIHAVAPKDPPHTLMGPHVIEAGGKKLLVFDDGVRVMAYELFPDGSEKSRGQIISSVGTAHAVTLPDNTIGILYSEDSKNYPNRGRDIYFSKVKASDLTRAEW